MKDSERISGARRSPETIVESNSAPGFDGQHVDPPSLDLALPEAFLEQNISDGSGVPFPKFKKSLHLGNDVNLLAEDDVNLLRGRTEALLYRYGEYSPKSKFGYDNCRNFTNKIFIFLGLLKNVKISKHPYYSVSSRNNIPRFTQT